MELWGSSGLGRAQVGQGKLVQHSAKGRKEDLVQDGSPKVCLGQGTSGKYCTAPATGLIKQPPLRDL